MPSMNSIDQERLSVLGRAGIEQQTDVGMHSCARMRALVE